MSTANVETRPTSVKMEGAAEPIIEWIRQNFFVVNIPVRLMWAWLLKKKGHLFNRNEFSSKVVNTLAIYASERVHKGFARNPEKEQGLFFAKLAYSQVFTIRKRLVSCNAVESILARIQSEHVEELALAAFESSLDCYSWPKIKENRGKWKAKRAWLVEKSCLIDGSEKNREDYYALVDHFFKLGKVFSVRMIKAGDTRLESGERLGLSAVSL